jgi:transcriptional regulator with XRE-family HTH domain
MSVLSQNIEKMRKDRNITQEQMAREIGLSRPTYINVESGERDPSASELEKIAAIFGVPPGELLSSPRNNKKFEQMYFYILRKFAKGVPKTKLAKLLYLTDFATFYDTLEPMSGVSYVRRKYGPVPDIFFELTENLFDTGKINIEPLDGGALMIKSTSKDISDDLLSDKDKGLMDKICSLWKDKRTQTIVNFTHEQKPWKACRDGEYIPYSLIIQEDPEHVYTPVA